MCGIYGSTKLYTDDVVSHKLSLIKFRGPDYHAFRREKSINGEVITLGHVRLSILDLDKRSNQPFVHNDNITIVFNGEIYNYEALKRSYLSDYTFRTKSDTEVICAMYEKYGCECVKYFNGMFAFVIFDKTKNILIGARDRLGKKPFYYHLTHKTFEFASQVKSLAYGNHFNVNPISRQLFLIKGYIPDPYCIYEDISKLRAGCYFTLDLETFKMNIQQYWDISSNSCNFTIPYSYEEAKEQVHELLSDAVKIRLNADVPVGMFLSEGIDSSLVSAMVSKMNHNITAYTIGFNDSKYNESNYAYEVTKSLGIPIKINYCEGNELIDILQDINYYFDEPFADNSLVPTSLLCNKTKSDVTVALGGDGGDELFFGYTYYQSLQKRERLYKMVPQLIRRGAASLMELFSIYDYSSLRCSDIHEAMLRGESYGKLYGSNIFNIASITDLIQDKSYLDKKKVVFSLSDFDMKVYLNSCINTKADRASMRSSLELRSPLMDYRLAEYSRLIPYKFHYTPENGGKSILKDILYTYVPKHIIDRPKSGFISPLNRWFNNELKSHLMDIVNNESISCYLPEMDSKSIVRFRDKFFSNSVQKYTGILFKIYTYINWCRSNKVDIC